MKTITSNPTVVKKQIILDKEKSIFPIMQKVKNKFLLVTTFEEGVYETMICDLLSENGPIHGYTLEASNEREALQNHSNIGIVLNSLIASSKDINFKNVKMYLSTL